MQIFIIIFFILVSYFVGVCQKKNEKRKLEEELEFYRKDKENNEIKDIITTDNDIFIEIQTSENKIIYEKYTFNSKTNKWEYEYSIPYETVLAIKNKED